MVTQEQKRKINEAISECDRFIAIEGPRSAGLRQADVQKTLDFYRIHRLRLIAMLEAA